MSLAAAPSTFLRLRGTCPWCPTPPSYFEPTAASHCLCVSLLNPPQLPSTPSYFALLCFNHKMRTDQKIYSLTPLPTPFYMLRIYFDKSLPTRRRPEEQHQPRVSANRYPMASVPNSLSTAPRLHEPAASLSLLWAVLVEKQPEYLSTTQTETQREKNNR
jgi:hypothetical protein